MVMDTYRAPAAYQAPCSHDLQSRKASWVDMSTLIYQDAIEETDWEAPKPHR